MHHATACVALCIQTRSDQFDALTTHINTAARFPRLHTARMQFAAQIDRAGAFQNDAAGLLAYCVGLDHAGKIDNTIQRLLARSGADQHHTAAIRLDATKVLYSTSLCDEQCVRLGFRNLQLNQLIAVQIQRVAITRRQRHLAQSRNNHAIISHMRRHQCYQTALGGADDAFIANLSAGLTPLVEVQPARHEIRIADIGRADKQTADVNLGTVAENDAVLIHQKHLAICTDVPVDAALLFSCYPVQRGGLR